MPIDTTITLLPLMKSQFCSEPGCPAYSSYAVSIENGPFEVKCKKHLPDNSIQEYWTRRMLLAAMDGDEKKARTLLRHVTAEARCNGYERCALIADVKAGGASSTYSNKDVARGAEDMAKQIARSIRLAEST